MSNPVEYYLNLVTSEHRYKPKFISWLTAFLNKLQDISLIADNLDLFFDIDEAQGVQLDDLGQIVGQKRMVNFQPSDGSSPVLHDTNYRMLLKAKVIKNQWKGDIKSLTPLWKTLFPDGDIIVIDNQDMTMNAILSGNLTLVERDLIRHGYIVPKPQTVGLNFYFGTTPFFAYDIETDYFAGYDVGSWALDKEPVIFAYDKNDSGFAGYGKGYWSD